MLGRLAPRLVAALLVAGCSSSHPHDLPDGAPSQTPHHGVASVQPVLGSSEYQLPLAARGFGRPRPVEISNGGDGTGIVRGITWTSWGKASSYGYSLTDAMSHAGPGHHRYVVVRAEVHAYDLGTCQGRPAYLRLAVRSAPRPSEALSRRWTPWGQTPFICSDYRH